MATRSALPFALSLIGVLACDAGTQAAPDAKADGKPPQAEAETPEADKADADTAKAAAPEAAGPRPQPKPNSYAAPSKSELSTQKAALTKHLDAGRKAVKAKDYAAGIAELRKAAAINPMHAKTLGELGWAYFNAGELDRAQTQLELGLHYARATQTQGAILYNLGRVAEAKQDASLAIEYYTRSLAVRPNDVVRARLAKLSGAAPTPPSPELAAPPTPTPATHGRCSWTTHGPAPRHLCHAYVAGLEPSFDGDPPECEFDNTRDLSAAEAGPDFALAAGESDQVTIFDLDLDPDTKLAVFSYRDYDMYTEVFVINVVQGGTWYSSEFAEPGHPGVGYADENVFDIDLSKEQLVPGEPTELLLGWHLSGHDLDPGIEMEGLWSSINVAAFVVEAGGPRWLFAAQTKTTDSYDAMDTPQPKTDVQSVELNWLRDSGEVEVKKTGDEPSAPLGTFALGSSPVLCPNEISAY